MERRLQQPPQCPAEVMSTTLFREDSPRPPVPGEEDKPVSGDKALPSIGRNLCKESQDSVRTPASSSCLGNSNSGCCQLPGVTPRRCHFQTKSENYGKAGGLLLSATSDFDEGSAPLGFEPEGSSIKSPPFTESYTNVVAHAKLSEGLSLLLEDVEGIRLFRQFVNDQLGSSAMEFFLACRGLKKMFVELQSSSNPEKVKNLAKVIFKKFVKSSKLDLKPDLKLSLSEKLKTDEISETIFDEALADVEISLTNVIYPQFLRCEAYIQYIQSKGGGGGAAGESPLTQSSNSSECSSIRLTSTLLPTLHEEEELKPEDIRPSKKTQFINDTRNLQIFSEGGAQCMPGRVCRLSGASSSQPPSVPVGSVQDSELQSLSSEALTDDTVSLTDSSLDGRGDFLPYSNNKFLWKKQQAGIKRNAEANQASDLDQRIVPRLQYSPKDQNIAEKDPERFAMLLTHRLLNIHVGHETEKTLDHSQLTSFQKAEKPSDSIRDSLYTGHPLPLRSVLLAAMATEDQEESAQNILESHMLRVFDGSSGQTPNHLMSPPGRHSPDQTAFRSSSGRQTEHRFTEPTAIAYAERPPCVRHSDRKAAAAAAALVGAEWQSEPQTHKCLVHQPPMPYRAPKGRAPLGCHASGMAGAAAAVNKASFGVHQEGKGLAMAQGGHVAAPLVESRKLVTSCHNKSADQARGLEMMTGGGQQPAIIGAQHPCALDSASEKVMMWMLENEKLSSGTRTQCSTECSDRGSSSMHKRSTTHFAPGMGGMGRQKQLSQVLPSQPIIQDPSMPLLTPPDPTTQLEEARRRLEQEARTRILQTRALIGGEGVGGEQRMALPSAFQRSAVRSHALQVDPISSSSDNSSNSQIASEGRAMCKRSTSVPTTPIQQSASDSIVIIYFFCDERIPYSTKIHGRQEITLAQFKQHLAKKGQFRYFFKRVSSETVYEEVSDDEAILPLADGKISAKISRTA